MSGALSFIDSQGLPAALVTESGRLPIYNYLWDTNTLSWVKQTASADGAPGGALTNDELRAAPLAVDGPLTDAQLRAVAVPVSHGGLTDAQLRAVAVPVSGTFWQAGHARR